MREALCPDDLAEGEVRIIRHGGPRPFHSIILVKHLGRMSGYWNVCRHIPVPLDAGLGRLDLKDGELVCATHGACYAALSGACTGGPPLGTSLLPVALVIEAEIVWGVIHYPTL